MSVKRTPRARKRGPRRSLRGRFSARLSERAGPLGSTRAFREGAGFFFQLVASLADYAVITTDSEGIVSSWNPGAQQVFGFSEEDIIGKPFSILFSKEEQEGGAPRRELDTAAKVGRALDETWHVRKDGSRFWAAGVVFPLRDEHGSLRGFTKIAQDLTRGKLLEQAAEFTAKVLSTVANSIPALVWYVDSQERVLFQNRPRLAWWRKEPSQVQNEPLSKALSGEAYRALRPLVRQALGGRALTFEVELPVDGSGRWVHADCVPDLDPEGRVRGIVCMITDISGSKTLERDLRERAADKERLAVILTTSADAIISKDLEGNIRTWNQGAERILGYKAEEIVGRPMTTIVPEDRLDEEHEILRRLHEGKPYEQFDTVRLAKGGREVHVSISVWPVRGADGRVAEAATILRDITERKEAEARLRAALERYDLAVEGAGIGTWELRPRGDKPQDARLEWSRLEPVLWGLPAGTASERLAFVVERIHPDDRAKAVGALSDVLARGADYREEFRVIWPDGSTHWLAGIARPLRDASGRVSRIIGINVDITARKAAEEAQARAREQLEEKVAERTDELRGTVDELERFTYTVAHDLRAPFRNVHQYVDHLLRKWPQLSREAVEEHLRQIAAGTRRMDRLIEDLLNYSKISTAKIRSGPLDLDAIVAGVVKSLEREIAERRAEVRVGPGLPQVIGDEFLLRQALTHLLTNALKFVPPDRAPAVRLGAEKRGRRVVISVQDNGIGIEPKYQDKVFGLFERLHPLEGYPGSGIGLAIVSRAAERLGGRVCFDSTPGQGSRFCLDLKAAAGP